MPNQDELPSDVSMESKSLKSREEQKQAAEKSISGGSDAALSANSHNYLGISISDPSVSSQSEASNSNQ